MSISGTVLAIIYNLLLVAWGVANTSLWPWLRGSCVAVGIVGVCVNAFSLILAP